MVPMVLDLFEIKCFPVPPHGVAEVIQKLDHLLGYRISPAAQRKTKKIRYLDDFNRLPLHALGPGELRPLLRFTRTEQDLETLLYIIHQVFSSIRIVQEILADDKLDGLLLRSEGERFGRISAAAPID